MASNRRLSRINSLLKEVISDVVTREVKNPNVGTLITITRVDTSADLHHAKVSISLIATDAEKKVILEALQSAAGFIAVHASKKVELRYFPKLTFKLDTGIEELMRIQEILGKIERERGSRPTIESDEQQD